MRTRRWRWSQLSELVGSCVHVSRRLNRLLQPWRLKTTCAKQPVVIAEHTVLNHKHTGNNEYIDIFACFITCVRARARVRYDKHNNNGSYSLLCEENSDRLQHLWCRKNWLPE